ncbi:unnamed protein product, partial [marine sediment metagenome]
YWGMIERPKSEDGSPKTEVGRPKFDELMN